MTKSTSFHYVTKTTYIFFEVYDYDYIRYTYYIIPRTVPSSDLGRLDLSAQGVGNLLSAWFSCAPMAASLSRSLLVDASGGRTQASGIITALLLLAVLLWLGPLFTLLPKVTQRTGHSRATGCPA